MSLSNSASSTLIDSLTLLPSRASSVLFTGDRGYREPPPCVVAGAIASLTSPLGWPVARMSLRQRLGASVDELDRTRLQDRCRGLDVTPLDQLPHRVPVRVGGEVKRVVVAPRNGVPNLEVIITDGSGTVTAVFAGRRRIPGIEHGRAMVLEGVAVDLGNRAVIYNPAYTLVP